MEDFEKPRVLKDRSLVDAEEELSPADVQEIFLNAPKNRIYWVKNPEDKTSYERQARELKRDDLVFEIAIKK